MPSANRELLALAVALGLVALFTAVDLGTDLFAGASLVHAFTEVLVVIIGSAGAATIAMRLRTQHLEQVRTLAERHSAESGALQRQTQEITAELNTWRERAQAHTHGLALEINRQLDSWNLSVAEKEIALLLIKGFASKEIAELRMTSEKTVRQQSIGIYRKAGLKGRAELAAFFLEDLLVTV